MQPDVLLNQASLLLERANQDRVAWEELSVAPST
jgi:hypothetical protein